SDSPSDVTPCPGAGRCQRISAGVHLPDAAYGSTVGEAPARVRRARGEAAQIPHAAPGPPAAGFHPERRMPAAGGTACTGRGPPLGTFRMTRRRRPTAPRSEEHTSELQSRENLVCRLL